MFDLEVCFVSSCVSCKGGGLGVCTRLIELRCASRSKVAGQLLVKLHVLRIWVWHVSSIYGRVLART